MINDLYIEIDPNLTKRW